MRHRTGSHRQRPALARRLPLYVLVLGLQVSIGASLMSGGSPTPRTVDAAAHELVTSPATAAPVRRPSIAAPRAPRAAQP
ncbi:MAG: hypothetical protein QOG49_1177, partial [Frankiaceae bacterium]|nr:hypothetical protein [Frankiaceae bacterium]